MIANILINIFRNKINLNPFYLTGLLYPLIDNGYSALVENRSGIPETKIYTLPVRISTKKKAIKKTNSDNTPVVYEDVYMMVSDINTIVDERLEFIYKEVTLKVIKRVPQRKYGILIGYEYELKDITEGNIWP